ncbi:MAG: hypothetical protein WAU01_13160 [Saprospiraceae bacterium]
MVRKAHLLIKIVLIALIYPSCTAPSTKDNTDVSLLVDTTMIPLDTILSDDSNLYMDNGIYYIDSLPYDGYVKKMNIQNVVSVGSYYRGSQHGHTVTYYENGDLKDIRSYREGKAFGRHTGYWENGHKKFEFLYIDDRREGLQQQWYESGTPYSFLTFKDDREEGMQKAWRENGKPYINYEVKDGHRYGMQKAALCYTLKDGAIK